LNSKQIMYNLVCCKPLQQPQFHIEYGPNS